MKGKHLLINAGPTREAIDPVRFISNFSSGKMGIALAEAGADYGAEVELVLGPVSRMPENKAVRVVNVVTAESMTKECIKRFKDCDIAILAAAVADYTPVKISDNKIRRKGNEITLKLKPTADIAEMIGKVKKKNQITAGFALETDDEIPNAVVKLKKKNFDLIVLNSLKNKGAGFGYDTNMITIIDRYNNIDKFELKSKKEVALDILDKIVSLLNISSE